MKLTARPTAITILISLFTLGAFTAQPTSAFSQQAATASTPVTKPVIEEWVYRTKYGYKDEWWAIFKKYQIAILERQKQLGYVKDFTVYATSLHAGEEYRWDYRVIIVRASADAPPGQSEGEVAKQLFPDQARFKSEENRRWELTLNHSDLPIHLVNLDGPE
jgi:hypothetical protein